MNGQSEQALWEKHWKDLARAASAAGRVTFSSFLTAQQQEILSRLRLGDVRVCFDGGYEAAERKMAAFRPLFLSEEEPEYPFCALRIRQSDRKFTNITLSHRDYLGAILGCGIERSVIGDLVIREDGAIVFVTEAMAPYLLENLCEVGRAHVRIERCEETVTVTETSARQCVISLSSCRLDAVVARGFNMGRSEAALWIHSGRVQVNHLETQKTDKSLAIGDLVTVRGKGRLKLAEERGTSRSGRQQVLLEIYG